MERPSLIEKPSMEILSPAGSYESVVAAISNGANAVYLGQQKFSARQNAQNFDLDTLKQAVEFCHIRGAKVYQAINTLVFDNELDDLQATMKSACELNVDAFIVQDLGVLELARRTCPTMRLHASTQMTVHTKMGAQLLKELGFSRVVLARELSLKEIQEIASEVDIEVEVFAHGALCMSVSGQCYMSAMIGTHSGNKGSCAGTCRMPFTANADKDACDLSLKDLCTTSLYKQLRDIGVTSLKIEGRMKRPEYVAATAKAYSELALDKKPDVDQLKAVFSRSGFTDGYLTGKIDAAMFGVRSREDVIAADAEVLASLRESYRIPKSFFPVMMQFSLHKNEPAKLTVSTNDGVSVTVFGDVPQEALNRETTAEVARESFTKLGSTAYFLVKFDAKIDPGLMLPKSKLNELRRAAVEKLDEKKCMATQIEFTQANLPKLSRRKRLNPSGKLSLYARFKECSQIPFNTVNELSYIYIPIDQVLKYTNVLLPFKEKVVVEADRIMMGLGAENLMLDKLTGLFKKGFTKLAVSNLAHIKIGTKLGFELFGTAFLNITNSLSAQVYASFGVRQCVLSAEAAIAALSQINTVSKTLQGIVGYGYFPLMIVRNCPIKRTIPCSECKGKHELSDRYSNKFSVECNSKRYSEILNSKRIVMSDKLNDLDALDFTLLYFTHESKLDCQKVITSFITQEKAEGDFTRGLYYRGIV